MLLWGPWPLSRLLYFSLYRYPWGLGIGLHSGSQTTKVFWRSWLATKAFPLAKPLSYVLSVGLFVKDNACEKTMAP